MLFWLESSSVCWIITIIKDAYCLALLDDLNYSYFDLINIRVGLRLMHVYHIYIMHYLYTYKQFKVGLIKIQHS